MGNSSAGTRGGEIKEYSARTGSSRVETSAAGAGTGAAGTAAEGPRPGGGSKRRRRPLTQGGARGQSRPPNAEGARRRQKAALPHPAHPRCWQQLGKGRRKKSQQGRGSRRNKCRRRLPQRLRVWGRKARPARRPPGLSLGPCPTALTLPHDALEPPFCHQRRHLPDTAEQQPPPPAREVL